jgi:hypothetical protein
VNEKVMKWMLFCACEIISLICSAQLSSGQG